MPKTEVQVTSVRILSKFGTFIPVCSSSKFEHSYRLRMCYLNCGEAFW